MLNKAEVATIGLLFIGAVYCMPAGESKQNATTSCPSSFCESAKYHCSPTPSCNDTSNETTKLECQCCQLCLIAEGDRCESDDGLGTDVKVKSPLNPAQTIRQEIIKAEEQVNKGKQCKQGLVCLMGTCVTLF